MKTILNSSAAIFSLLWSVAIWNKSVSGPAGFWELQNCCLRVSQFCTPPWQYFIRGLTQLKYFGFKWSRKTCSRCAVKSGRVLGVHSWRMRFLCVCCVMCVLKPLFVRLYSSVTQTASVRSSPQRLYLLHCDYLVVQMNPNKCFHC